MAEQVTRGGLVRSDPLSCSSLGTRLYQVRSLPHMALPPCLPYYNELKSL